MFSWLKLLLIQVEVFSPIRRQPAVLIIYGATIRQPLSCLYRRPPNTCWTYSIVCYSNTLLAVYHHHWVLSTVCVVCMLAVFVYMHLCGVHEQRKLHLFHFTMEQTVFCCGMNGLKLVLNENKACLPCPVTLSIFQ